MPYGYYEHRLKEITDTLRIMSDDLTDEQIEKLVSERSMILENLRDVEDIPL